MESSLGAGQWTIWLTQMPRVRRQAELAEFKESVSLQDVLDGDEDFMQAAEISSGMRAETLGRLSKRSLNDLSLEFDVHVQD